MVDDCLFCSIVAGTVPTEVVHDTGRALVFRDVAPQAPVHLLAIPREHHRDVAAVLAADPTLLAEVVAAAVAAADGAADYRLVANTGPAAGQTVPHAHVHLLSGRDLGWPPG